MMNNFYKFLTSIIFVFFMQLGAQMGPPQMNAQDIDSLLSNMSEKEFNDILEQLSKMSPEELEELEKIGRQVLIDSGIDPDTGKPLEQIAPETSAAKPAEQAAKPTEVKQSAKVQNVENVQAVLDTIKRNIDSLRQKSHESNAIARRLSQWNDALTDLIFYIKVINKKEHRERLATKDFITLFSSLETLARQLQSTQPHIIVTKKGVPSDDPYLVMHLNYDATSEEITAQHKKLENQYSPKRIKKNLKAQNASQKEINREVRAAELTRSLINDAYHQLHDPKTKKLVDEKRTLQKSEEITSSSQQYLTQALEAISNAIYQQKALDLLQDFLKKYEPEQLAHKQALDAAQAERIKYQKEAEKVKPLTNTSQSYDKKYPSTLPAKQPQYNYGYDNYRAPYGGNQEYTNYSSGYGTNKPSVPESGKAGSGQGGAGGAGGGKGEASKKSPEEVKKEDDLKKKLDEKTKADKDKKEKADKDAADKKLSDLEKELAALKGPKKPEAPKAPAKKPAQVVPSPEKLFDAVTDVRGALTSLKKALRAPDVHKLLAATRVQKPLLEETDIATLKALPLDRMLTQLTHFEKQLAQAPAQSINSLKNAWRSVTEDFNTLLAQFKTNIDTEVQKYSRTRDATPLPFDLIELRDKLQESIEKYNTISAKIIQIKPLPELPSEEPDEDLGLDDLFQE